MRNGTYLFLYMLLLALVLGGCAGTRHSFQTTQTQEDGIAEEAGTSMGGAVSAITAAVHEDEIQGAILLYPAFVLVDNANEQFESVEDISDTYYLMWMTVGHVFVDDLLDYDIYEAISAYKKDVLLIHGDADSIVPLSYSEKAVEAYDSALLEVLPGAGHGFYGSDAEQAVDWMQEYLEAHKQ